MNTVLKFPLEVSDLIEFEMPKGARVLEVGQTRAQPCVWALVEEGNPMVLRRFRLTATSEPIPDHHPDWRFVGIIQVRTQECHLWDLGERPLQ